MSTTAPLNVKVIYSASSGRRRGGKAVTSRWRSRAFPWFFVGLLNLIVAGACSYATWWRVDPFIYDVFTWKTPLPGVDADQLTAQMFPGLAARGDALGTTSEDVGQVTTARYTGKKATMIIGTAAYSWLALATIASCALALSAGSAMSQAGGLSVRQAGGLLAVGALIGLAWAGYEVLSKYGFQYPPRDLRFGMSALVALAALIGLATSGRARGFARLAAITLILSALGTAIALRLAGQCDAVSAHYAGALVVVLAFVVHSLYGWLLLCASFFMR